MNWSDAYQRASDSMVNLIERKLIEGIRSVQLMTSPEYQHCV
jgi:hypothetical protein